MEKFSNFFHNGEQIFLPNSQREKDNLINNLFKSIKDTISKTNTCFRQHHNFLKENFSKKRFCKSDLNTKITPQDKILYHM